MEPQLETICKNSIIYNKIIPFKGYKAINLFGFIFARTELSDIDINHERIHTALIRELLFIFFYIWYLIEWLVRSLIYWDTSKAYRNICFEKEAYNNQDNLEYLNNRKFFAFLHS